MTPQAMLVTVFALTTLSVSAVSGQSFWTEAQLTKPDVVGFASALNPYLGLQAGYMLTEGSFEDNVLLGGAFTARLPVLPENVPVLLSADIGNLLIQSVQDLDLEQLRERILDLAASRRGFVGGLYPYWRWINEEATQGVVSGMLAVKVNRFGVIPEGQISDPAATSTDDGVFLWQLRAGASVEVIRGWFAVGVGPVFHIFSADTYEDIFGERKSTWVGWEAHAGFPANWIPFLPERTAFYVEWVGGIDAFGDRSPNGFRVALVYTKGPEG